jgi:hypothetical protein
MTCGIYKLTWANVDGTYIGKSIDIESSRWPRHLQAFASGKHTKKLQPIFNKFGTPTLEIVEKCLPEQLQEKESYWISKYDSINAGFNTLEADGYPTMWGETNGFSKYKDTDYACALFMLVYTDMSIKEISADTRISYSVISNISSKYSHSWLEDRYPLEYSLLCNRNHMKGRKATIDAIVLSPDGKEHLVSNIRQFAKKHDLQYTSLSKLIAGKAKTHKNWRLK